MPWGNYYQGGAPPPPGLCRCVSRVEWVELLYETLCGSNLCLFILVFLILLLVHPQAKSQFKRRSTANNVEIIIPVPMDADSPKFKSTVGACKYAPEKNAIVWTIKAFPVRLGGRESAKRSTRVGVF